MTFSDPRWLWALLGLPWVALLAVRALRVAKASVARLVGARQPHALLAQWDPSRRRLSEALTLLALACLIVGAAGPQWGREVVRRTASGSDLVFVIDVSASMDSRDVPPSRLDEARREALAVLDRVPESRVGIVAFAGDASRLCPLTLDHAAARLVLESLTSGSVSEPGTDLGRALRMAARVMPGGRREEQAIMLWTDGEDLEQQARSTMDELAHTGIRVLAVGVGTPEGSVVPVLDDQGRAVDIKLDENGAAVRSRLDESLLRQLAQRTRGAYFSAGGPGGELSRLLEALGGLERGARAARLSERPVPRFPLFAVLAALLLLLDRALPRRRAGAEREAATPLHSERGAAAIAIVLMLLLACGRDAAAQSAWARGDRAWKAGRYADAESLYTLRLLRRAPDEVRVNRATAAALRGATVRGADPGDELRRLSALPGRTGRAAGYNLGTLLGGQRQYDPALQALRNVLERDPTDDDARWNYELLLRRRREEPNASRNPTQPQSQSQSQPQSGRGGGNPPPQAGPSAPANQNPQPGSPGPGPQAPSMRRPGGMDREQADRLLGALQDLERLDQQRRRQVRVMREKHGRDW